MTAALELIRKVFRGDAPLRAILWATLTRYNSRFRQDDRRWEFERLYSEKEDPWGYFTNPYENEKYARTLQAILAVRPMRRSLLEVACSVGAFTRLAAEHFDHVTGLEISAEALVRARRNVRAKNVDFVRGYVQSLDLDRTFDVITCAEVLVHVSEAESDRVCDSLRRHLAPEGIVIYVAHRERAPEGRFRSALWRSILGGTFREISAVVVDEVERPYEIVAYRRS
jgi:2-polyprenyl-3-methyl-5-hydroxy-6-metoxy-1,4-benzoquinol methylase